MAIVIPRSSGVSGAGETTSPGLSTIFDSASSSPTVEARVSTRCVCSPMDSVTRV